MPKTREQKEMTAARLADMLRGAKSVVFAKYEGLPVKDIETLRRQAKEQGVVYTVVKKTLLRRALQAVGFAVDPKAFDGNFATVVGKTDEVTPAKLVAAFAKEHEAMKIAGGVFEGKAMDAAGMVALAKLPTKKELLGSLVGTLQAPVSGFVNVLAGNLRGLVTVLGAIREKKTA